jgi:hypothetical protein
MVVQIKGIGTIASDFIHHWTTSLDYLSAVEFELKSRH